MIAVVGWIANHLLSVRAQNKQFLNGVYNDARKDVVAAIRDYQDWLGEVDVRIWSLDMQFRDDDHYAQWGLAKDPHVALERHTELRHLFHQDQRWFAWNRRLEDYAILFPTTVRARIQLQERHNRISSYLSSVLEACLSEQPLPALDQLCDGTDILWEQLALVEDLRRHIENLVLSRLIGERLPKRVPAAKNYPRFVLDEDGNLHVVAQDDDKGNDGAT